MNLPDIWDIDTDMSYSAKQALNAYQETKVGGASYANPHQLITMLLDGLIERVSVVRLRISEQRAPAQGREFAQAVSIIDALTACLDHEQGGELSDNLAALYDYMQRRLFHAAVRKDLAAANEVLELIHDIRGAWLQIPAEYHNGVKKPDTSETGVI